MIRKFEKSDTDRVISIWLKENIIAHAFIDRQYWLNHLENVKNALAQAEVYIYDANGETAGFAGLNGDYIEGIFVDGKYQSKGIGKALLNHIKKTHSELTLNAYVKNKKAIQFYIKEKFKIIKISIDESTKEAEAEMKWIGQK